MFFSFVDLYLVSIICKKPRPLMCFSKKINFLSGIIIHIKINSSFQNNDSSSSKLRTNIVISVFIGFYEFIHMKIILRVFYYDVGNCIVTFANRFGLCERLTTESIRYIPNICNSSVIIYFVAFEEIFCFY